MAGAYQPTSNRGWSEYRHKQDGVSRPVFQTACAVVSPAQATSFVDPITREYHPPVFNIVQELYRLDTIYEGEADGPVNEIFSPLTSMQLGRGEAEVIEYAHRQPDCAVLLDDRAGRRAAQALGLRVLGTLSVVAIAAQQGQVASFDAAAAQLRSAGLYASDEIVDAVRRGLRKEA